MDHAMGLVARHSQNLEALGFMVAVFANSGIEHRGKKNTSSASSAPEMRRRENLSKERARGWRSDPNQR
jgi:hypothetical protein